MASKQPGAQPDKVWLRSESLGEEREFTPDHAERLQALEASQGHHDWCLIEPPTEAASPTPLSDSTAPAADDPKPRKRTRATRKPR